MLGNAALTGHVFSGTPGLYLLQRTDDVRFTVLVLLICSLLESEIILPYVRI
jgi:hypothetical protein